MRSPVYRHQWMIVLTSIFVAGMSVASGETFPTFFAEPHPEFWHVRRIVLDDDSTQA